jgi:hypothetical protein
VHGVPDGGTAEENGHDGRRYPLWTKQNEPPLEMPGHAASEGKRHVWSTRDLHADQMN